MHCNGKCHLKKQLEKENKKESSPTSLKEKSEIQFYSTPLAMVLKVTAHPLVPHFIYLFSYSETPDLSIFHPPSLS